MKNITILLAFIILVSCSNDDNKTNTENNFSETDINLVTGINIRNSENGNGTPLGNPNIYKNDTFTAFPNPPIGVLTLQTNNLKNTISNIWVTPANAKKIYQETDFNEILSSSLYTENQIDSNATLKLLNQSSSSLSINLESLQPGYYKVFVELDGKLYWDNFYKAGDIFEIDDLITYWE
jgi:hypothetical protein|tara:strand:- start:84319 stop:84858 length:540 start_codon:yes stop_codon:yes gene_type:complete